MFNPSDHHLVKTSGKRAFEKGYPDNPLTAQQYNDWRAVSGNGLGVMCGLRGNLYAIDIDEIEAATETLLKWNLPPTLMVTTSRDNKFHYIFQYSGSEDLRRLVRPFPGIDLLGRGGYFALHEPLDRYNVDYIAELPANVVADWVTACTVTDKPITMSPGGRNNAVASLAGALLKQGVPLQQAHDELQTMNAGAAHPLQAVEVAQTVASIARYHPEPKPITGNWPFQTLNQIAREDLPIKDVVIGPFMSASVVILAATRGTGKTAFATAIGQSVASGEDFCGMPVNMPGPVAFVQLDMGIHSVKSRAIGTQWHDDFHYITRWHFQRAGMPIPNLGDPEHHANIVEMLKGYRMVIFDTRRACQPPGSGADGNLWHPSYWLKSAPVRYQLTDEGCCVVLLDHLTDTGQVKDTKAIEDDADTVIALKDSDKGTKDTCFQMELTKDRDHVATELTYFEFDSLTEWRMFTDESRHREVFEYRQGHTIAETAEEFQVSERTVKNWCRIVRAEIRETNR